MNDHHEHDEAVSEAKDSQSSDEGDHDGAEEEFSVENKSDHLSMSGENRTVKSEESKRDPEDQIRQELADYKDRYIRLYAEFDNVRKRHEREKMEFVKYASEKLIVDFLGILDNLELSLTVARDKHVDYEAFIKGVEMVMNHIHEMLRKNGVKQVEAEGKHFDPNCHEVLMQENREDVEEGAVIGVFQKGYCLHDKVIRTAKVKLACRGDIETNE
jgi:molecular chaperone GrpE